MVSRRVHVLLKMYAIRGGAPQMSEQAKKLVEEFREAFECYYDVCMDIQFGQDDRDVYIEQRAEHLIDCVGQAYADGMPLPGEVDRWKGGKMMVRPYFSLSHAVKGLELIALSPSGIPVERKEEEK